MEASQSTANADEAPNYQTTPRKALRPYRNLKTNVSYEERFAYDLLDYFEAAPLSEKSIRETGIVDQTTGKITMKQESRDICARMPTFEFFARSIDTSAQNMQHWEAKHPEFALACARAREIQHEWLYQQGLSDRVTHPSAYQFVATNVTSGRLRSSQHLEVSQAPQTIDVRPDIAAVPAQDLERFQMLGKMLQVGLSESQRKWIDRLITGDIAEPCIE